VGQQDAAKKSRSGATRSKPAPRRAVGRSLSDFKPLRPAEKILLECARKGENAVVGDQRPEAESRETCVRATFLRFLALGGDEAAPVHEHGILLEGAWLEGPLNLNAATAERGLVLWRCRVEQVIANEGRFKFFNFMDSTIEGGFSGDGLSCEGDVALAGGCHVIGTVRLPGARIGGDLNCQSGRFDGDGGDALMLDRAVIAGSVFLSEDFHSTGDVRLLAVHIGGSLVCTNARFENGTGDALSCDRARIGSVSLREGFYATGQVRFLGAEIKGDLDCTGSKFERSGGTALSCDQTRVVGRLLLRGIESVTGNVDLSLMELGSLIDSSHCWDAIDGNVLLDGFTYSRFAGGAPTNAPMRIQWLCKQIPNHLAADFRPQPWEQAIAVLRSMGHLEAARQVAIAKQDRMRSSGRYVGGSRLWDLTYRSFVGYGYRPWRLLWIAMLVWLACAGAYSLAIRPHLLGVSATLLAPSRSETNVPCLVQRVAARSAADCPRPPPDYGNFVSLAYSAEVLLPVISLGSKADWKPVVSTPQGEPLAWGWMLFVIYWLEIAFGWLAGLLLVAAVGNLVKKD
jgi:hypothetical protein